MGSTVEPARTEEAICWLRERVGGGSCGASCADTDAEGSAGVDSDGGADDGEDKVAGVGVAVSDGATNGCAARRDSRLRTAGLIDASLLAFKRAWR